MPTAQNIQNKVKRNEITGFTLSESKTYYKATIIKRILSTISKKKRKKEIPEARKKQTSLYLV